MKILSIDVLNKTNFFSRNSNPSPDVVPFKIEDDFKNILVRSLADDQVEIMQVGRFLIEVLLV